MCCLPSDPGLRVLGHLPTLRYFPMRIRRKLTRLASTGGVALVVLAVGQLLHGVGETASAQSAPGPLVPYHGGPLIRKVEVVTLFWNWNGLSRTRRPAIVNPAVGYFNGLFQSLFADGRYMANLSQYSTDEYP